MEYFLKHPGYAHACTTVGFPFFDGRIRGGDRSSDELVLGDPDDDRRESSSRYPGSGISGLMAGSWEARDPSTGSSGLDGGVTL